MGKERALGVEQELGVAKKNEKVELLRDIQEGAEVVRDPQVLENTGAVVVGRRSINQSGDCR